MEEATKRKIEGTYVNKIKSKAKKILVAAANREKKEICAGNTNFLDCRKQNV